MIKVKRIDHVAIAVAERDASAGTLNALFGLQIGAREHVAEGRRRLLRLARAGGVDLEA